MVHAKNLITNELPVQKIKLNLVTFLKKQTSSIERSRLNYAFLFILLAAFLVRIININYNTAFNDEGIYIVIGRLGLFNNDWYSYGARQWMAGSPFIYPTLAAISYELAGLYGARLLNIIFGILFIEEVYRFTRLLNLFDKKTNRIAGVLAAFFAAFSGIGIYVSMLATYDMPSFLFMIFGINSFLKAKDFDNGKYYFLSALSLFLAFMTKIITAVFFPALFVLAFLILKTRSAKQRGFAIKYFFIPFFLMMSLYMLMDFKNLFTFYSTHKDNGKAQEFSDLIKIVLWHTNFLIITTLLSISTFIRNKKQKILGILLGLALIIPTFHIALNRTQTFNKHLYLSVAFLSVISGYGFAKLIQSKYVSTKLFSRATLVVIALLFFVNSQSNAKILQNEWVNTTNLQKYLNKTVGLNDKVLTENGGAVILSLYDKTFPPKNIATFDWINYANLEDDNGYYQAINDVYFDYIELDHEFSEKDELRENLKEKMKGNYSLVYQYKNFEVYKSKYK